MQLKMKTLLPIEEATENLAFLKFARCFKIKKATFRSISNEMLPFSLVILILLPSLRLVFV